jgi:hypothetical protein
MAEQRFFRSIVLGGAGLVGGATLTIICGSCGENGESEVADSGCAQPFIYFLDPCGATSITTTCSGALQCDIATPGARCSIGSGADPITANCDFLVSYLDGGSQTIPVKIIPGAGGCPPSATYSNHLLGPATCPPDAGDDGADGDDGSDGDADD